jgi:hypothetical protein
MKVAIFKNVAACGLADISEVLTAATVRAEVGIGKLLPDYTSQHPKRLSSSEHIHVSVF